MPGTMLDTGRVNTHGLSALLHSRLFRLRKVIINQIAIKDQCFFNLATCIRLIKRGREGGVIVGYQRDHT